MKKKMILGLMILGFVLTGCEFTKKTSNDTNSKEKEEVNALIQEYQQTSKKGDNAKIINLEK